jgi:glyoxylase-like metal-dependent hydrolase (beta-lactamase superfamily II)
MEVLFVGTGAADHAPALACGCRHCRHAQRHGGRSLRTYASILTDGWLLTDCGDSVPWRLREEGVPAPAVSHLLITHHHRDHFSPDALRALAEDRGPAAPELHLWAPAQVVRELGRLRTPIPRLRAHVLAPFEAAAVGAARVLPLPANHGAGQALLLVVETRSAACLYATDTAWPPEPTLERLAGLRLDGAIIEATFGPLCLSQSPELLATHLSWSGFTRLHDWLRGTGVLPGHAPCLATHLSMHWNPPPDETVRHLQRAGADAAWDGRRLALNGEPQPPLPVPCPSLSIGE